MEIRLRGSMGLNVTLPFHQTFALFFLGVAAPEGAESLRVASASGGAPDLSERSDGAGEASDGELGAQRGRGGEGRSADG